ncbi:MAG: NAD(P)H-hydrate epimerase [Candidatus Omnitrophota bacterium]
MKEKPEKSATVRQIQRLDQVAIEEYGIPSLVLMENAGRCVFAEIQKRLRGKRDPLVCVFCGLGNNGGDGFVVARHLLNACVRTKVFLAGRPGQLKSDAAVNYHILHKLKYPVVEIKQIDWALLRDIRNADIIVDAIFGVGLNRDIVGLSRNIIEAINLHGRGVVSVDLPSGLDGTTGKIFGVCVQADETVTFALAKKGFYRRQGPKSVGKVRVADIGIPGKILRKVIN